MSLRLDFCGLDAASYSVAKWHYSRSLPTPPRVNIGVWEQCEFIGAVIFSRGTARHGASALGVGHHEFAELTRVALRRHESPVSRILSIAIKIVRKQCPGLRVLVSFADPAQGHHGGIYQAGGWVFIGQGPGTTEYLAPDGKRWHSRMISPTGRKKVYGKWRSVYRPDQCQPIKLPGKLKYAMPLDAAMKEQLEKLRKPYTKRPTRAGSIDGDAAANHAVQGGSIPTSALSR